MMTMQQKKQSQASLISLLVTIIIPSCILVFFKETAYISTVGVVLIALAFPVVYSCYEWLVSKKVSFVSILGFISVLLTGGIAVLQLPAQWIAVKESLIPFIIGCVVFGSCIKKKPAVRLILHAFLDDDKINQRLIETNNLGKLLALEIKATYILSCSFLLSSVLNFILAKWIVRSPAGTEAFNTQLGMLTALSYPIIAVPSMLVLGVSIWYMIHHLKKLTQLPLNQLVKAEFRET